MIDTILDRLGRLHPKVIDLSLDRILALLDRLGRPQDHLPPVVHVAGTNGKGSTIATLRAIAETLGLTVHVYTSPHLVRFAERIRIAGRLPSDEALEALLKEVEHANDGAPVTFFEVTTAAAFLAFSRTPADLVILETGLGGRLDATNVVVRPAATVITPIDLDHQQFLGNTLAAIAGEKAGILKAKSPCVVARQPPEALAVLCQKAQELGITLTVEDGAFAVEPGQRGGFLYKGPHGQIWSLPAPALAGTFQHHNCGNAIACAELLADAGILPPLRQDDAAKAVTSIQWPARLQRLTHGPLINAVPPDWEVWLDGGHNPHAGRALADHAASVWSDRPLFAVFGILTTKDISGYLTPLLPHLADVRAITIPDEANAMPAAAAAEVARRLGCATCQTADSVLDAARQIAAAQAGSKPARLLVCGSLYLAGSVLAENG